jgi:hypothetical protein
MKMSFAGVLALSLVGGAWLAFAGGQPPAGSEALRPAEPVAITVYKDPNCGCCTAWEEHLEANGFVVDSRLSRNMGQIKAQLGLPQDMASCHTGVVDGVLVEGHVPADVLHRFLAERPTGATGIAVPGMPMGSPGMEMPDGRKDPYNVMAFDGTGKAWVYSRH